MTEEPFGRQPQPVRIDFTGDLRDVDYYMKWIAQVIENGSYAITTRMGNQLTIHPGAVND